MRALKVLVVLMGVLIVAGVVVVIVTITQRMAPPTVAKALPAALLDEPPGTHIVQISAAGDRLSLLLQGGGPDRVVVLDLRQGSIAGRAALAQ